MATTHPIIIRRREVEARTGLSRSGIYAKLRRNPKRPNDFDLTFPRPIQIGPRAVGWIATEINQWVAARAAERDWEPPEAPDPAPAPTGQRTRRSRLWLPKEAPIIDGDPD